MFLNAVKQSYGVITVIFNTIHFVVSKLADAQRVIIQYISSGRIKFSKQIQALTWFLSIALMVISNNLIAQDNPYEYVSGHPKIIMTKYDELALRFTLLEDPLATRLKTELKKDADKLLSAKDLKYSSSTFHEVSEEYLNRIITLSLAYRLFEEDKYSDKAIDQMLDACAFPDWQPTVFQDLGIITAAMAIGYDWNFYRMDLRQNETIRNKIVEFALNPVIESYKQNETAIDAWFRVSHGANTIGASGFILGALAVGEDFPDLKNNVIYSAVRNLLPTTDLLDPDGIWYQGPDSWVISTDYLVLGMSALNSSLGHDFGLSARPGMDRTCEWYRSMVGPSGLAFNFGVSSANKVITSAALFWLAARHDDSNAVLLGRSQLENLLNGDVNYKRSPLFYLALPWIAGMNDQEATLPKASVFNGAIDFITLNGSGEDKERLYLAAKGGNASLEGQQLDAGSFVLDALGVRWGIDPGSDKSATTSKVQSDSNADYWNLPNNNNLNHNTLVIDGAIQSPEGDCRLIKNSTAATQPFGVIDLTPAYPEASKAIRGFKLLNNEQVLMRDEIALKGDTDTVRWAMVTDASVALDGKNATLTKEGKSFYVSLISEANVDFSVESTNIPGNSRLTLRFINPGESIDITLLLGVKLPGDENSDHLKPIDLWK